jgi:hypothetical protein
MKMSLEHRHRRLLSSIVAPCCLVAFASFPAEAREDPAIEPFARQVLEGMSRFLGSAESLTYQATAETVDVPADGLPSRLRTDVRVAVRRPDRLYVDIQSDEVHNRVTSDGQLVRVHDLLANAFAMRAAPGGVDEVLALLEGKLGVFVPLSQMLRRDPLPGIMEGVTALAYVGLENVAGATCHHVAARQDALAWEAWIEDGTHPVPRKLVFHLKDEDGTSTYTAHLGGWGFSTHLPDAVFEPPIAGDVQEIPLRETPVGGE